MDTTWGDLTRLDVEVIYEPTLLLYCEGPEDFGDVTLMDGPLPSVYPTDQADIYTLSSVTHTPLGRFGTSGEARAMLHGVGGQVVAEKVERMIAQMTHYLPSFRDQFRYVGPQFAIKTKPVGASDDRSCLVAQRGRAFSVLSGKIDNVFFAVERILFMMEAHGGAGASSLDIVDGGEMRRAVA